MTSRYTPNSAPRTGAPTSSRHRGRPTRCGAIALPFLLFPAAVAAQPGFYVGLGGGTTAVAGQDVTADLFVPPHAGGAPPRVAAAPWSTDIAGGLGTAVFLGYSLFGYVALETSLSAHGRHLGDPSARAWAAHWHVALRGFPLWHWQRRWRGWRRNLEPSAFWGRGLSYQGYAPTDPSFDDVGWQTRRSTRWGVGLQYPIHSQLKLGIDYAAVSAPYAQFIYNFDASVTYPLRSAARTTYHQILASVALQVGGGVR